MEIELTEYEAEMLHEALADSNSATLRMLAVLVMEHSEVTLVMVEE